MEYTHEQLLEKVEQLKSSVTVSGIYLIKSNKFTEEFYAKFCAEAPQKLGVTNRYDLTHLTSVAKTWSDEEIYEQIKTMLLQSPVTDQHLEDFYKEFFKTLKFENYNEDEASLKQFFEDLFAWGDLTPLHKDFWIRFGSAPYFITENDSNKKLAEARKNGARGMRDIFGNAFENMGYRKAYYIDNKVYTFKAEWDTQSKLLKEKAKVYSSPFKNLEDLQENVTIKNSANEAKIFYMDKTKKMSDRVNVFESLGESHTYIHTPHHRSLKQMFEMYSENDWCQRHETVYCTSIVEYWVENLEEYRCSLDWTNSYHPKLVKEKRNYEPSKEAIKRLHNYYLELLFLEGVAKFEFDW